MKLGALHLYIVIFAIFSIIISLMKEWIIFGLVVALILVFYIANGIEYMWIKEIK
jgi:hypothetical protein